MSNAETETERQLVAAREAMDRHREALSTLAKSEPHALQNMTPEMRRQMEIAKERMKKYHAVYRALAK